MKALNAGWVESELKLSVASTVAVIGYPYDVYDKVHELPIWKTGSIASEPYVDYEGESRCLIDVAASPGMSGAPVVALARGAYEVESIPGRMQMGWAYRLVGVYASNLVRSEGHYLEYLSQAERPGIRIGESLQLGSVWKASLVREIVDSFDAEGYAASVLSRL